jgi:hypothetical protein
MDQRRRALEEQIERGILRSERSRQTILAIVLLFGLPFVFVILRMGTQWSGAFEAAAFDRLIITTFIAVSFAELYEFFRTHSA